MRRIALVVVVAGLLAFAGCVDDLADDDGIDDETATDENATHESETNESETSGDESDSAAPVGEFELHHIDVGQGDATLLIAPSGETMLVDSGDWPQDGQEVIEYLDEQDIDRIDRLVATHAHADHIGGHAGIIEEFETERDGIGAVYDSGVAHTSQTYENYLDAVETHDLDLFEVREGDSLPFGENVTTTVLNPPEGDSGTDLHYNSVALAIEFGSVQYLMTGDAERDAESRLVEDWETALPSDLYHAGHHGSSTSSTDSFLDEVDPESAVISSDRESQYGHPHDEVLERFDEHGIETYWTGAHGDIVVSTDGDTVETDTEHEVTTDPAELLELKHDTTDSTTVDAVDTTPTPIGVLP